MEKEMYIELERAQRELITRQDMQVQVEAWWHEMGWGTPPLPEVDNRAVLARHVATARYEDIAYSLMAHQAGLTPTWLEYTADRFVCKSPYKRSLVKRTICDGKGKKGGWKRAVDKVIPIESCKGHRICDLSLRDGEQKLVDYHHNIQDQMIPGAIRQDFSSWLSQFGKASDYYAAYLSCFIAHAVLFEDYHGGESGQELDSFTTDVFEIAHAQIKERFGVDPLMVQMIWSEGFDFYPANDRWNEHQVIPESLLLRRAA